MRDGPVAHPVDQRLLDLHDRGALDPGVGQHLAERETQAEPADHDRARVLRDREGRGGQRALAADLAGVHDEDPVGTQLQHGRTLALAALAEHQLAPLGLGPGDLGVLHLGLERRQRGQGGRCLRHAAMLPGQGRPMHDGRVRDRADPRPTVKAMSADEQGRDASEQGQVSEVQNLDGADEPISDDQSVAGQPDGESGDVDEGPTGPNARAGSDRN